jgi:hypothetical protein
MYVIKIRFMIIYIIYSGDRTTGEGISFSASNLKTLSEKAGIGYWNLVRIFIREKKKYWESKEGLVIIKSAIFYRSEKRGIQGLNAIKAVRNKLS